MCGLPIITRRKRRTRLNLTWVALSVAMGVGPTSAQIPQSLLDRLARLDVENVAIEVALQTLHRSSGVAIAFSPDLLPPEPRVTCHCRLLTVREALDRLLDGTGLQYQAGRRQILIGRPPGSRGATQSAVQEDRSQGVLEGQVLILPDSQPLAQALVTVRRVIGSGTHQGSSRPTPRTIRTGEDGRFTLALPPGQYRVVVEALGVQERSQTDVGVLVGQTTRITVHVSVSPIPLNEIVVAPSTFGMLRAWGPSGLVLTREELEAQPGVGNDIIRTVEQLPGISTTDYSAKPFVRGARAGEVLTMLDGLELHEPYHLKYWDGSLSIVDMETVSGVSVATGGFSAEYGDKSAGVLAMRSADPPVGAPRTTIGLDFMSSIVKSEGTFQERKGTWLASARRGFLGFVFDLMNLYPDEYHRPSYYDLFSRVQYEVRPGHRVSAQILHAGDDNRGEEMDGTVYRILYGNSYGWLRWEADFRRSLSARTVASVGRVAQDREGTDFWNTGDPPVLRVDDENTTWYLGLRQDWQLLQSARTMLKWGFDLRWGTSNYDYFRAKFSWVPNLTDPEGPDAWPRHDTVTIAASRSGSQAGAYLASRLQVTDGLTVEAGLRYDRQSHTGEHQVSPRIHAAWQLTPGTALRGAWGHYHQSQGLAELWAADADTTFYPAQKAEHRVLGLEQRFGSGYSLRLEAYQRRLSDPLPEYRRVARNLGALWEEALEDRVFVRPERGRAEGIEMFVKSPGRGRLAWSGSYALSRTEEKVSEEWVPRPYDQRHAVNLQIAFRPTADWSIAAGWIYHSPWPFTEVKYLVDETVWGNLFFRRYPDVLNQGRLTPYKRLDFRASRKLRFGRGELLLYVDVFNLLNRQNAMDLEQWAGFVDGRLVTDQDLYPQLGIMPSVGLKWTF
ncbi:TonB-dependent receptor domain-containing protein [Gemmatimonadota bacterium]